MCFVTFGFCEVGRLFNAFPAPLRLVHFFFGDNRSFRNRLDCEQEHCHQPIEYFYLLYLVSIRIYDSTDFRF